MVVLAALVLTTIGLQLAGPRILGGFIDAVQGDATGRRLLARGTVFIAVAFVGQAASLGTVYVAQKVGWRATNALRADLTQHCLELGMGFHKSHTPGELIERIDSDVTTLANLFSQMIVVVIGNGLLTSGVLYALSVLNWRMGLIGALYIGLTLIAPRTLRIHTVDAWRASREAAAALFGYLGEYLFGREDIRANGAEAYVLAGLDRRMHVVSERWVRARVRQSLQLNTATLVFVIAEAAAIAVAIGLHLRGQATLGTIYTIGAYIALMRSPIDRIQREISDFQRGSASIERIEELMSTPSGVPEPVKPARNLPPGPLPISVRHVSFAYDDEALPDVDRGGTVLHDISFDLAPGQTLGLLGHTGSGKTTLARLLFRLYDPTEGEITLGNVPIREVALDEVRRRIAFVTQEVRVFRATVRDNLTLFDANIPDEHLLSSLDSLGLQAWFASLPEGLDTQLGAGAEAMSAGQAQLLALARAFLRSPDLYILDEASARLDPITERLLDGAIERAIAGRPAVIIAHRLSTVQRVDTIMMLDQGRIMELGSRQKLLNDPTSHFARLLAGDFHEVLS